MISKGSILANNMVLAASKHLLDGFFMQGLQSRLKRRGNKICGKKYAYTPSGCKSSLLCGIVCVVSSTLFWSWYFQKE
ncbi:hypothetical protein [Candidatus Nitrososphaera evergladensis]|uniref:hypothetical protein n=1 Tax=Candidatus Nitrososphaera evergladensis TaxID=1459637 RepID=UPI0011E591BA|nr:hypothetical protein [Candidatus Nitrososphaera evergladensis]